MGTLEDCILNGPMHKKWEYCLTGELTEEETRVSSYLTKMWTSFAVSGHPGFGAKPWSSKNPVYLKITDEVKEASDYRKEYHIASDQVYSNSTSTTTTISSSTMTSSSSTTTSSTSTSTTTTSAFDTNSIFSSFI